MAVTAEQLREWVTNAPVEQSEVERRILASRHYYATFHKCRPLAEAQGLFTGTPEALTRRSSTR